MGGTPTAFLGRLAGETKNAILLTDLAPIHSLQKRTHQIKIPEMKRTPTSVGMYRDPSVLLDNRTTVTVGVEGVGKLANICCHR